MAPRNRREFLAEVGQGVVAATIGYGAACELGLMSAVADEAPARLSFGARDALVDLMQETPIEKLLPALSKQLQDGTTLRELVAAGALANARAFGGEDYIGFHTFMALAPALHMANQFPGTSAALPVFKVLYRNTNRMHDAGVTEKDTLHPLTAASALPASTAAEQIRQAVHDTNFSRAEEALAGAALSSPEDAYNALIPTVSEAAEVHRTVLAYRAWDLLDLVGRDQALTFLRQSLHYVATSCKHPRYGDQFAELGALIPKLLDQYRLVEIEPGTRQADDAWLESMSNTLLASTPAQAADAAAAALADGFSPTSLADAIALTTNQLVLRDPGRTEGQTSPGKPVGSVHGDSIGVHACDSANAWRNLAQVGSARNRVTCLLLSAWEVGNDRRWGGPAIVESRPRPSAEELAEIKVTDAQALLDEIDDAIRQQAQARACALVQSYGDRGYAVEPVQNILWQYAVSQDGALHAEKYYRTATEEFSRTRPKFRWRQMVALARVTASEYGRPAPGIDEAKQLLGV